MMLSIIITNYNNEKYIERCIESLIEQEMFSKCEVIIVDDGSTDKSVSIIDKYEKKYQNINLFIKENGGVSSARNYGINVSSGDYITFIDGDDYVKDKYISKIFNILNSNCNLDMIQFNTKDNRITANVWSKCFSKKFLKDNDIEFNCNCYFGEDMVFSEKAFMCASKVFYLNDNIYIYSINENSITNDVNKRLNIYESIDDLLNYIETKKIKFNRNHLSNLIYRHGILYVYFALKNDGYERRKDFIDEKFAKYHSYLNYLERIKIRLYYDSFILSVKKIYYKIGNKNM